LNDKADETLRHFIDTFGDHPTIHRSSAGYFLREGDYDVALSEINKALLLDPDSPRATLLKGHILFHKGDLAEAEVEYQKLLKEQEVAYQSYGLTRLWDLYSLQGKFKASEEKALVGIERAEKAEDIRWISGWHSSLAYTQFAMHEYERALKELDRTWDFATELNRLDDQSYCLCLRGLVYLGKGSMDSAQETADELQHFLEQNKTADTSYHDFLLGSIELERKNFSQAISFMEKTLLDNETNILYSYSAALAYYRNGDLEKAQIECEKILSPNPGARMYVIGYPSYFDLHAKSYYLLGKIHEKKGWPGKAIENYEKFLDLWKDADPGIAEVEDARERLTGLKNE
jgi:tetratricopeptide (TPR) repeat protein